MPSEIFNALPGLKMSVNKVTETLSKMWQGQIKDTGKSVFRASQMDLVLHLGLETKPEEALERFNTAVKFAQKYPCRIIILCPTKKNEGNLLLQGKLFSQCYLGDELRDLCCCEALTLSYPIDEAFIIEDQVSLWLEGDLPTYYWINRVHADAFRDYYISFTKSCRKVIYDSSIENIAFKNMDWPKPENVNDLVLSRLLPIRQSMGQFLSAYPPTVLVDGLKDVVVKTREGHRADAELILNWLKACLLNCINGQAVKPKNSFKVEDCEDKSHCMKIEWTYERREKYFRWYYDDNEMAGKITAAFHKGKTTFPQKFRQIPSEEALAEAIFY